MPDPTEDLADSETWLEGAGGLCMPIEESLSIGRASSNGLALATKGISRSHSIIHERTRGQFWLVDLGSRNGTWVNSRRILQPVRLRDGDRITLGEHEFVFRQAAGMELEKSLRTMASRTIPITETRSLPFWLLIADIENFTQLSQELPGQELADLVGKWLQVCQTALERHEGRINKYLGDGFFAVWEDMAGFEEKVLRAVEELTTLSKTGSLSFRIVVHCGCVSVGGSPLLAEESFIGSEVNFIFRMEKVAGSLAVSPLFSEPAAKRLGALRPMRLLPAQKLKGFEGQRNFYTPEA
jgi:adenylate cyclase